jgi:SagB-type dehydrogenase family enzyme
VLNQFWNQKCFPEGDEDLLAELFHENSKLGRLSAGLSNDQVVERMEQFQECLDYRGYPLVQLAPPLEQLNLSLTEAISTRESAKKLAPSQLTLQYIATLLHYSYGASRRKENVSRSYRVVPSAGALYPLEIYFSVRRADDLAPGLYHYHPVTHSLRILREGEHNEAIANAVGHPDLVLGASLVIFITAFFERSVFKYGDRGYRFILLEGGHVAQNLNLVSNALHLGSVNIGGFFDREIDDFIGLDGVTHSTIYMVAIGKKVD